MIARSTLWGTIQTGDGFRLLSEEQRAAVLAHERGHIRHRHAWKRLWWLVSVQWKGFFERCEAQELEADHYAAQCGHREGLVSFLTRWSQPIKSDGYPTVEQRLENLRHVR